MLHLFSKKRPPVVIDERLSHIAFIMDGNGRWAKRRGLPRKAGHVQGAATFKKVVRWCQDMGIRHITVYAFSTENWKRPKEEVEGIMRLLSDYLDEADKMAQSEKTAIRFLGDLSQLSPELLAHARDIEARSAVYKDATLQIALSYGGRAEIVHAVNQLIAEGKTMVSEEDISSHLYTFPVPDPDLVVRTGGEVRTSNFLMWQSAYTEYVFTKTLWPDFSRRELENIIADFMKRHRRYGGV